MNASKTSNTGAWDFPAGRQWDERRKLSGFDFRSAGKIFLLINFGKKLVRRAHGVFSQQVVFGVSLATVHRPQGAEQRPPPWQDLRRAHLHQLSYRCYYLQGDKPEKNCLANWTHSPEQRWLIWLLWGTEIRLHLVLNVLVAELQLHDVLERPEQCLVKVEVWKLRPARQHLCENIMDKGNGLLGYVALFVTRSLWWQQKFCV